MRLILFDNNIQHVFADVHAIYLLHINCTVAVITPTHLLYAAAPGLEAIDNINGARVNLHS